ncbi:MAG TPA: hypothetical protein VGD23_03160 [Sphingomicrobium sp.]
MPYVRNKSISVVIPANAVPPFELNENNGKGPGQKVDFKNSGHPGIVVYFNIRDPHNTGLVFQPVPGDALWVAPPGQACPTSASAWEEFVPLSVEKKAGKNVQLIAYYRNQQQEQFNFALRFLKPDGTPVDYDPIGNGMNGLRS